MKLISGLGNPKRNYRLTRHNVGFLAIDRVAKDLSIKLKKCSFSSLIGEGGFKGKNIILLKPLTFMNLSGEAVASVVKEKNIHLEEIIVICDDINLELGRIRIRRAGGDGGHNGLKSIIENLGTDELQRLRIGIGTEQSRDGDFAEYVLEKFHGEELEVIDKTLDVVSEAIKIYIADGIETAMNRYNNMKIT